jgi:hypothetical protein
MERNNLIKLIEIEHFNPNSFTDKQKRTILEESKKLGMVKSSD